MASTSTARQSAAAWTPRRVAEELRVVLADMREAYNGLLKGLFAHREAIRGADASAIAQSVSAQQESLSSIERAERRRREVVAGACSALPALGEVARKGIVTIGAVIEELPEAERPVLAAMAAELKSVATLVKNQSAGIRAATTSLVAHMEGLMQQVGKKLSHSGVYGRRGVVEAGGAVVSGLDMKS